MNNATMERSTSSMPDGDHFARNLIGGRWTFPAAPYEFEIRNPSDSTITAVVPLSSRFDVDDAFRAATAALSGPWVVAANRVLVLQAFLDQIDASRAALSLLQSVETGLSVADSTRALDATLDVARTLLNKAVTHTSTAMGGVTGHVLSWGLPFTEIMTSLLPVLLRGDTAIVKPSLRGPLTPVAFGFLAAAVGIPAGVVNIVQGTGVDVGAELISRRDLSALYVRAGERTIAQAERSYDRSHVPLRTLRAGGNVAIVGPDNVDLGALAEAVSVRVRMHSCGGPFGLPLLAVHRDQAAPVVSEVLARLSQVAPAPLPTEPLRKRAVDRIDTIVGTGARVLLGGTDVPDDIAHRMGWRLPPTVLDLGGSDSPAVRCEQASSPLGPVMGIFTWDTWGELAAAFTSPRAHAGTAFLWGVEATPSAVLPHGLVEHGQISQSSPHGTRLPKAWLGGAS
jgi:acyl-CoA reductase-like NAD-dependent aldehyde dehydrogenase